MSNDTFDPHDYVRWVQRSLNRLLEISLAVEGDDRSEPYRSAVKEFNRLCLGRDFDDVDEQTQNALIEANERDPSYVIWVQSALNRALDNAPSSGMDATAAADLVLNNATRRLVSSFQRTQTGLRVDGFVGFKTELALMGATGTVPPGAEGADAAAFIDQSGHPGVGEFYRIFPDEPPAASIDVARRPADRPDAGPAST